ncbi:Uncharacterised protein [Vibrio cholerae]|nr:Uncharacterised protein [Vibrio cholerae]
MQHQIVPAHPQKPLSHPHSVRCKPPALAYW